MIAYVTLKPVHGTLLLHLTCAMVMHDDTVGELGDSPSYLMICPWYYALQICFVPCGPMAYGLLVKLGTLMTSCGVMG